MKIIKEGKPQDQKEVPKKCGYCKTKFTYLTNDIQFDFRDGDYLICPVCKKFLAV